MKGQERTKRQKRDHEDKQKFEPKKAEVREEK
jgi:hypothetical protein